MTPAIDYKDSLTLVFTDTDEYGAQVIDDEVAIKGLVVMATGFTHGNKQDAVDSDAQVYIDPSNADVIANFYRLEEALVVLDLFDTPAADSWYKVTAVNVARDHLLDNKIDNVTLSLKKTASISHVS